MRTDPSSLKMLSDFDCRIALLFVLLTVLRPINENLVLYDNIFGSSYANYLNNTNSDD